MTRFELEIQPVAAADLGLGLLAVRRGLGSMMTRSAPPSRRTICPSWIRVQGAGHTHHRGDPEGVGEDRGVRGSGALLADQPDHVLPVELHREPGREFVRHHDDLLVGPARPGLALRVRRSGLSIRSWIAVRSARRSRSCALPELPHSVAQFERLELVGRLRARADCCGSGARRREELGVLRHEDLGVEDPGFLRRPARCSTRSRSRSSPATASLTAACSRATRPRPRAGPTVRSGTSGKRQCTTSAGREGHAGGYPDAVQELRAS